MLAKEKDRRLVPGFISDHTISSILKDNKSKYVEIIFLLPDAKANKLLFFSDNIRRDFRDSESLSIVYCGIASNDAEREMLSELNRRYPEETFLYISKADYVSMMNALSFSGFEEVVTLDQSGNVLNDPLRFKESEFYFRKRLRGLLR